MIRTTKHDIYRIHPYITQATQKGVSDFWNFVQGCDLSQLNTFLMLCQHLPIC